MSGSSRRDGSALELQALASAMLHELRTPLAALSSEVEVALRRDRTAAEYQLTFAEIAERVKELLTLTSDLAFLGYPSDWDAVPATARLDVILLALSERYASRPDAPVTIESSVLYTHVVGRENRLVRGLTLLLEHAVRHRREDTSLRLRVLDADEDEGAATVDFLLEASPPGYWPRAWHHLAPASSRDADFTDADAPGLLRLRTVDHLVRSCGGSVKRSSVGGIEVIHLKLLRA